MIRAIGPVGLVMFCVWLYAVIDVISTDEVLARNLPKSMWVFIVLFFPGVGAVAWLALGRPLYVGWRPGDTSRRPARPASGTQDPQRWTHGRPPHAPAPGPTPEEVAARQRRLDEWEAELDRRERELRDDAD
ncbi:MAG: hypothetical protein GY708_28365 [Actinomycetia bacterium]|nr:hypothetical protein [Actinomycetes bacterium]MCP4959523.1 hypothetical protein [Actinomycetes bacterium]